MTKNDRASRAEQQRLAKLLEFKLTDRQSVEECVAEVRKAANLSDAEARIVAAACRNKSLPASMLEDGLTASDVNAMLRTSGFGIPMTSDFAKDISDDTDEDPASESLEGEIAEHGHVPTSEEEAAEGETPEEHSPEVADAIHQADMLADGAPGPVPPTTLMKDDQSAPPDDSADADGEVDDDTMATIQLRVPADQIDAIQQLLDEHFGSDSSADSPDTGDDLFGTGDDLDFGDDLGGAMDDAPLEEMPEGDSSFDAPEGPEKSPLSDKPSKGKKDAKPHAEESEDTHPQATASRKVQTMTRNEMAQRQAEREKILAKLASTRTASDEENQKRDIGLGRDTTDGTYMGEKSKPFQYAGDAQYTPEDTYETMSLEGSEGNSLRKDNPTYAKQDIPTMNPENLGLKSGLNAVRKEGSPDETADYVVDFDLDTHVISGDPDRSGQNFAVPTQMGTMPRKTTVAAVETEEDAEEALYQLLVQAGVNDDTIANLTYAQGLKLYREITAHQLGTLHKFAADNDVTINLAEDEVCEDDRLKNAPEDLIPGHKSGEGKKSEAALIESLKREAENFKARVKTAYAVNSKFALAGIIQHDEVDANVEMWLSEGLSVKSMLTTGAQFLKMAQSATERVASAQQSRSTGVRTASSQGVVNVPAFATHTSANNPAVQDLQSALRAPGFWGDTGLVKMDE